ncbi:MAG TPA: polysaccharide biosynthesis tyrosine autokinase [Opitutaceae bacterium]|nr:polysaccharide biosynthesis tyrosine autokinase [Opitutaceae bacterium]
MASSSGTRESASIADLFRVLRQRWVLIALIMGLVLATTLLVTAFLPRWYLSTAKVGVEKPESEVKLFQAQGSSAYDPYFMQDQFRIMQDEKILYPVIERLGLQTKLAAAVGAPGATLPEDVTYRYLVAKMLRIESQRSSSLIEINVYAQQPELAAEIANAVARAYSDDRIAKATSQQEEGLSKLEKELVLQQDVVTKQRDVVEKLRKDLNISGVDLNAKYSDMEIETLRQMQNSLIALRVDAIGRKTRWERFKSIPVEDRIGLVNSELIPDQNIQNLLQAYLIADQKVTQLKGRLGEAHPDLVSAIENRSKMKEQLEALLRGYESGLEIAYKEAEARVEELESQLAKAKVDQILSARDRMRPFEEAAQKLDDETRLYTTLKLTLRQREIDFQVPKRTIEILNTAEPARRPSRPNWILNIASAIVFGGFLAVGVALALEYFDMSLRDVADVEDRLKVPVLGVIPHHRDPMGSEKDDPAEAEPYRVLHTNLNLALKPDQPAAIVVFSAGPAEGKSTTICRLAHLMGAYGERVLLVDGDLCRPAQHHLAACPRAPGLSDVLAGKCDIDSAVRKAAAPGLDLLTSGGVPGFSLSLLFANRLRELVASMRGRYDRIMIDSPPIIGVSDSSLLAGVADGAILLIQHRRNPASMVLRAQQVIAALKVPILGAVLTQVPRGSGEDYGYYTQAYSYYSDRGTQGSADGGPGSGPDKLVLK